VEEPCLVEFPEEMCGHPYDLSFLREIFWVGSGSDLLEILNQMFCVRDFEGKEIGLIERERA
jgi:hypothetical protein